jgi:hypothetical protein
MSTKSCAPRGQSLTNNLWFFSNLVGEEGPRIQGVQDSRFCFLMTLSALSTSFRFPCMSHDTMRRDILSGVGAPWRVNFKGISPCQLNFVPNFIQKCCRPPLQSPHLSLQCHQSSSGPRCALPSFNSPFISYKLLVMFKSVYIAICINNIVRPVFERRYLKMEIHKTLPWSNRYGFRHWPRRI